MSRSIEERVVQMEFENESFERKAKQTTKTLNKLDDSLAFKNGKKSFKDVERAASETNFSSFIKAADTVTNRLSNMGIVGVTALTNITNKAVNAGERLIKSLSTDQIVAGWNKMDQITRSSGTLIAQGYDMSEVEEQISRLNWFTDETSYNLTDMVDNISKFTATGKGLTDSATAMEGIALWAALSGQNATTASRAMFQLSQALGAGYMRLEDYKSIQNASMDTDEFRQKTLDAAVALGTLQKNADDTYTALTGNGTTFNKAQFAQSLTEGMWFTSDVMMEVFKKYSATVDQVYEYANEHEITASQAIEELGDSVDEFGLKAFRAGQEARTFGDAIDSTKDAVSTGWMTMFKTIFGNYDQQRTLWTDLANGLYDFFAEPLNDINSMLSDAFAPASNELSDQINLAEIDWSSFKDVLADTAKSHSLSVESMIADAKSLDDVLKQGWLNGDTFADAVDKYSDGLTTSTSTVITAEEQLTAATMMANSILMGDWGNGAERIRRLTEAGYDYSLWQSYANKLAATGTLSLSDFSDIVEESVGIDEDKVKSLKELSSMARDAGDSFSEMTSDIDTRDTRSLLIEGVTNLLDGLVERINWVKSAWKNVFPSMTSEQLRNLIIRFNELSQLVKMGDKEKIAVNRIFRGIAIPIKTTIGIVKEFIGAFSPLTKIGKSIGGDFLISLGNAGAKISRFFASIKYQGAFEPLKNMISALSDAISETIKMLKRFGSYIKQFFGKLDIGKRLSGFLSSFGIKIPNVFDLATSKIKSFSEWVKKLDAKDFEKVGSKIIALGRKIKSVAIIIWTYLSKALGPVAEFINSSVIQPFVSFIKSVISSEKPLETLGDGFKNIGIWFSSFWSKLKKSKAGTVVKKAIEVVKDGLAGLVKFVKGEKENLSLGDIIGVAGTVGALVALQKITGVFEKVGLLADTIKGSFATLNSVIKTKQLSGFVANMNAIARNIFLVALAITILAHLPVDKLKAATIAISIFAVLISVLSGVFGFLAKRMSKNMANAATLSTALSNYGKLMLRMGVALLLMSAAVAIINKTGITESYDKIANTVVLLLGMAAALGVLAFFTSKISGKLLGASFSLMAMATAMVVMSMAVSLITKAFGAGDPLSAVYILSGLLLAMLVISKIGSSISIQPFAVIGLMILSVLALVLTLEKLTSLDLEGIARKFKDYFIPMIVAIGAAFVATLIIGRLGKGVSKAAVQTGAAALALVGVMYIMTLLFDKIVSRTYNQSELYAAAGVMALMAVILIGFVAVIGAVGKIDKKSQKFKMGTIIAGVISLIGAMAVMLFMLKSFKGSNFSDYQDGLGIIGIIALTLAGLMMAFGLMGKWSGGKGTIAALAIVLSIIAVLAVIVALQEKVDFQSALPALGILIVVAAVIAGIMLAFGFAMKTATANKGSFGILIGIFLIVAAIGATLAIVARQPWEGIAAAGGTIVLTLLAMIAVLAVLKTIKNPGELIPIMIILAGVMIAFAGAMAILGGVMASLSNTSWGDFGKLAAVAGILLAVVGLITLLAKLASSVPVVAVVLAILGAILIVAAASIMIFVLAMERFQNVDAAKVAKGLKDLAGPMALVGLAGILMIVGALGMIAGAVGILALSGAAYIAAGGISVLASAINTLIYAIARIGWALAKHGIGGEVSAAFGDMYEEMNAQKDQITAESSKSGKEVQEAQAAGIAENTSVVTDAIDEASSEVTDKIEEAGTEAKETATEQTQETIDEVQKTLDEESADFNVWDMFIGKNFDIGELLGGLVSKVKGYLDEHGLADLGIDLGSLTDNFDLSGLVDGLKEKFSNFDFSGADFTNITESMSGQLTNAANNVDAEAAAAEVATKYTEALGSNLSSDSNKAVTSDAGKVLGESADSGFRTVDTSGTAQYFVQGIAAGIRDHASEVYSEAAKLGKNSITALNTAMDIHSPSKETYRSGKFFVIGLSKAILDYAGIAYNSATDLASGTMYALNSAIDGDISNPRITPVLDMSDVYAQMRGFDIDGTMRPVIRPAVDTRGINPAIGNMRAIAAVKTARENAEIIQNGSIPKTQTSTTTFNQYNYSPKALSRKEIYRRTNNLVNSATARRLAIK